MILNQLPAHPVTGQMSAKALLAYAHAMRRGLNFDISDHRQMWRTSCSYVRLAAKIRQQEIVASRQQRFRDYYQ